MSENKNPSLLNDLFIGRQPIFDRDLKVIGYELLYRSKKAEVAIFDNGDQATSRVLTNAFLEIGIDRLVGQKLAFINFTRNFLTTEIPLPIPPERVILEVLETIDIDQELIKSLENLQKQGFQFALDDVISPEKNAHVINRMKIIKIDIRSIPVSKLAGHVRFLRQYPILLLAEKVESQEEYALCRQLGFDYFQGYFLCRPNIVEGRRLSPNRAVILRMVARLQDPNIEYRQLEEIIAQDVTLGYKLLRLSNSAVFGTAAKITSIPHAMAMIGMRQLKGWLTLFLLSEIDDKPREVTIIAMTRARMCEKIGIQLGERSGETYFLVGLFSVLDALMDLPIEEVISTLNLSDVIADALIHRRGKLGQALEIVLDYEHGNWDKLDSAPIEPPVLRNIYLEAIEWIAKLNASVLVNQ